MFLQNQMTRIMFSNPYAIAIGIPLTASLLAIYMKTRKNRETVARRLILDMDLRAIHLLSIIKIFALIAIVIAMSQPYIETITVIPIEYSNALETYLNVTNILILLDISKSMGMQYGYGSRYSIALDVTRNILEIAQRRGDIVSIAVFSSTPRMLCRGVGMNISVEDCLSMLNSIEFEKYTAIGDAIIYGANYASLGLPTAIIVITDGAQNYGTPIENAIEFVKSRDIALVIVLIGDDSRAQRLRDVANIFSIPLIDVPSYRAGEDVAIDVSEHIYRESIVSSLKAFGRTEVYIYRNDFTPTYIAIIISIVLFIASIIEGV